MVIDKSAECAADPGYLLTVADFRRSRPSTARSARGRWLLFRSGWDARAHDAEAFLNAGDGRPAHARAGRRGCARWLGSRRRGIAGFGVETVGIDAGAAGGFDPGFPVHSYLLGAATATASRSSRTSALLPPTGAVLVVAPLKLVGGTGSPIRVLALVGAG